MWDRDQLAAHLRALGLGPGDVVMAHAALRSVGPMLERGATMVGAILQTIGGDGTLLAYADWDENYERRLRHGKGTPENLRSVAVPFDSARSPARPENGALAEVVRTWPGALRSGNPGASMAAIGVRAEWFVRDHALDYGYGERSPLARLVEAGGKVLMIGAPLDRMTLLHHAEHLAEIPGKRIRLYEVPLAAGEETVWRTAEEFDTSDTVVPGLAEDYFRRIVEEFLATGAGRSGLVGNAPSVLVPAQQIVAFAVAWLELRVGKATAGG